MRSGYEGGLWGSDEATQNVWDIPRALINKEGSIEQMLRDLDKKPVKFVAFLPGSWCETVATAIIDPSQFEREYDYRESVLLKMHRLGGGMVNPEVCREILRGMGRL